MGHPVKIKFARLAAWFVDILNFNKAQSSISVPGDHRCYYTTESLFETLLPNITILGSLAILMIRLVWLKAMKRVKITL